MSIPKIPEQVTWRNGMVLEPTHFRMTDQRTATLSYMSSLVADPWPWGFTSLLIDDTALASKQLTLSCDGIFPGGIPFRKIRLSKILDEGSDGQQTDFHVFRSEDGNYTLQPGQHAPSENTLPVAKLVFHGGVWSSHPDWSAPVLLIDPDHPIRIEVNRQLGSLAALGAGFAATLRLPGAEERPVARILGQVSAALLQGVGVIQALLAAPAVSPGLIGIEALRLALGVRGAARIFEHLSSVWDAGDQRGSIRRLLYATEAAASGIGLPFRANLFVMGENDMLMVDGAPNDTLTLAIEAARPADLIAARSWLEGAALAAPDRINEALSRRVAGCSRQPIERDPKIGISSGPLLALYHMENDAVWRAGQSQLALAAEIPPPINTSYSVLMASDDDLSGSPSFGGQGSSQPMNTGAPSYPRHTPAPGTPPPAPGTPPPAPGTPASDKQSDPPSKPTWG